MARHAQRLRSELPGAVVHDWRRPSSTLRSVRSGSHRSITLSARGGIAAASALLAAGLLAVSSGEAAARSSTPCTSIPPAQAQACGTFDGTGCAPESQRVDLVPAVFCNPTDITNPWFPVSRQASVLMHGIVDGGEFRTEVTLLPYTKVISIGGVDVEALVSQYSAFIDGQIDEVALDFYAQADDGAVWYLGEDVFNYEDGEIADTNGTWLAGRDGPAAMIMPANPHVGQVYRPENAPGFVFEEVTVTQVGVTVAGPNGPVPGAINVNELHMDGGREDKQFAPGYGEFHTGNVGGDFESLALASPADALPGPIPAQLLTMVDGAAEVFDAADDGIWHDASDATEETVDAWDSYRAGQVPPLVRARMTEKIDSLGAAVAARDDEGAQRAALEVMLSTLDLQLRHRAVPSIDRARLQIRACALVLDAAEEDAGAALGDVVVLEWTRDRFIHTLTAVDARRLNRQISAIRTEIERERLGAASRIAELLCDEIID